jgi:hypothetical protein
MSHPIPHTVSDWFDEIRLAIADAGGSAPVRNQTNQRATNVNLFHLAPLVCLKFRGKKPTGREAKRVTETALANYSMNFHPEGMITT